MDINDIMPQTGRQYKEDGSVINAANSLTPVNNTATAQRCAALGEAAVLDGNVYTGAIPITTLDVGQTIKSTFETPADKMIVFKPILVKAFTGDLVILLYEGSNGVSGGTVYPATNRNRQSTNVSESVITLSPTVTTNGTAIGLFAMMRSETPVIETLSPEPLILKSNTTYTLTITNTSLSANSVAAELSFIED